MNTGFGPYGVVSAGEILGTLVILAVALLAMADGPTNATNVIDLR